MKHKFYTILVTSLILTACGGDNTTATENKTAEAIIEQSKTANFRLNPTNSKADWERTLDQKPTKQKVMMFGKEVEVDLGEVKLTSNGSVTIKEGGLTTTDDAITEATVIFDMASFKFAKEKDSGLFDVTNHPNSTMVLSNFSDSTATGNLTIQGTSNKVDVELTTASTEHTHNLTGTFMVNTLDFPLREKVKAKNINKDEIKVSFVLEYVKN